MNPFGIRNYNLVKKYLNFKYHLPLLFGMLFSFPLISQAQTATKGMVDIIPIEKSKKLRKAAGGDVHVVRSTIPGLDGMAYPSYEISFFVQFEKHIQMSKSVIGADENYTQCLYEWKNDTLLSIILQNSETDESLHFEVFANSDGDGGSGILMPDQ